MDRLKKTWTTFRAWPDWLQVATWVLAGVFIGVAGALQVAEPEIVTRTETLVETETVYQCADGQTSNVGCPDPTTTTVPLTTTTGPVDRSQNTALKALCQAQFNQECVYDFRFGRWVPDPHG